MRALLQDLRYGFRTLSRSPGFTATAVIVLALGIGANASIFSLANALFLRPMPVADADSVVRVYSNRFSNTPYAAYLELRDRNSTLTGIAAFQLRNFAFAAGGETEHAFGEIVTGNYFPLLGIGAARGRLLRIDDDAADATPAVVLAHAFWKRRFGAAEAVVGQTLALNGQPFTVVGVAPPTFTGVLAPLAADFWVPLATDAVLRPAADPATRLRDSFHLVGRLQPGVTREAAQSELDTIARQYRIARGETTRERAVTVYGSGMIHPEASQPVTAFTAMLMTLVALVLLIVCVNLANLVLARAAGRDVELAVRQSMGAGRWRLVRQLLTENLLLAIGGAAGGLAIAFWLTRLVTTAQLPTPVPLALDLSVDVRVFLFTLAVAVAATLAFGTAPALTASRLDLVSTLKGSGGAPRHKRLRSAFLVAQVSMSVLLLVTAGLFIRSFRNARSMDIGFDPAGVIAASVDFETRGYTPERAQQFLRTVSDRLAASAGVLETNAVDIVPLTLSNTAGYFLRDTDAVPAPDERPATPQVNINAVGPGHFRTLRISMLAGRDFTYDDRAASMPVAIVNETFVRRFWADGSPLGRRIRPFGRNTQPIEVIGIVRDSKYVTFGEEPRPFVYRPLSQAYTPRTTLLVRSRLDTASTVAAVKREVAALDGGLAVYNTSTLADAMSVSLVPARVAGLLLAALGALALMLAALGIYAVLSFLVRSRRREIGVRVAIGATPQSVAALVVRQAMTWTTIGAVIGVAMAAALTRFLTAFLYGISPLDPLTFGGVTAVLVTVAAAAAILPAVRASRMDPLVALRQL